MRSFIEINQQDLTTIVHITEGEHEHVNRQRGINDQTRVAIDKLYESCVTKPKRIIDNLNKQDLDIEMTKLRNYLSRLRTQSFRCLFNST